MTRLTSSSYSAVPLVNVHTHLPSGPHIFILQRWVGETVVPGQVCSVGIHPKDAGKAQEHLAELERRLAPPEVIAIGETGLDNRIDVSTERQEAAYIAQLKLAARHDLPVILHCVGSWDRCRALHQRYAPKQPLIYHGFSKPAITEKVLAYPPAIFSIGARLLQFAALQEAAAHIPIERLLLETDDSETDLMRIYEKLAAIKSLPLPAVIDQLYTNFRTIFNHGKLA